MSLLPISGRDFEKILLNNVFSFFSENNLITQKQSGCKPGDSCINQLLSVSYEIYKAFNDGFEVRSTFLDISKAFDKVWHQGVIFKLRDNGILDDVLKILSDFLCNQKINGCTQWLSSTSGVPQGSN